MDKSVAPKPGDHIVFKRKNGAFDVQRVVKVQTKQVISNLTEFAEVLEIAKTEALGLAEGPGRVWLRHHATPNVIEVGWRY